VDLTDIYQLAGKQAPIIEEKLPQKSPEGIYCDFMDITLKHWELYQDVKAMATADEWQDALLHPQLLPAYQKLIKDSAKKIVSQETLDQNEAPF